MELPDSAPVVSGIHSVLRLLDGHSLRAVKNLVREGALKDSKCCVPVRSRRGGAAGPRLLGRRLFFFGGKFLRDG